MPWDKNFPLFQDDADLLRNIFNIASATLTNGTAIPLDGAPANGSPTKPIVPGGNGSSNSNTRKDEKGDKTNSTQPLNFGKGKNMANGFGMDQDINDLLGIKP